MLLHCLFSLPFIGRTPTMLGTSKTHIVTYCITGLFFVQNTRGASSVWSETGFLLVGCRLCCAAPTASWQGSQRQNWPSFRQVFLPVLQSADKWIRIRNQEGKKMDHKIRKITKGYVGEIDSWNRVTGCRPHPSPPHWDTVGQRFSQTMSNLLI